MDRPVIVNATAIGHRIDGITVYGVKLVQTLWHAAPDRPITVVLNEDARPFFPPSTVPPQAAIRWVSASVSPGAGTPGNARRWLFANRLAREANGAIVFGLSQLEAPIVGAPGVIMVHDMIPWLFREAHPRQYYFYRYGLGRALQRALAVVTPSQSTKDDVCRYYGIASERVHVIRHGSPVPVLDASRPDTRHDRYILWIGRPDPTKNLRSLLAAFRLIERELDVRLILAGEGSQIDLSAKGLDCGSLGRVTVLGPVTDAEKIALLDGASVLVSPSLYEGFGFAPLEAMARGCPVVAARSGALPEVCADAAIYADPREPRQIADALRRILTRPELARALAERGHARTHALTWDASVRAHLAVFDHAARLDDERRAGLHGHGRAVEADAAL
jgi:glycosyltransferase involved in cell wall biosynthesis